MTWVLTTVYTIMVVFISVIKIVLFKAFFMKFR